MPHCKNCGSTRPNNEILAAVRAGRRSACCRVNIEPGADDVLNTHQAVTMLRGFGIDEKFARQLLEKRARVAHFEGEPFYSVAEVRRVAEPYIPAAGLEGQADMEYRTRIEAQRCTWQLKDAIRPKAAQQSIEDLPLWGGDRQGGLF